MPKTVPSGLSGSESKTSRNFLRLFKVTLAEYSVILRFVEADLSYVLDVGDGLGKNQWSAVLGITRGKAEQSMGLAVDKMDITLPNQDFTIAGLGSDSLTRYAALGVFDDATVDMYIYDLDTGSAAFWSRWIIQGSPQWSYESVSFSLESEWSKMDRNIPRTIIQEQCNNKLFDPDCALIQSQWQVMATISSGATGGGPPTRIQFDYTFVSGGINVPTPPIPDHWFELGSVIFQVGAALAPLQRFILHHVGLTIQLATNLPFAPTIGDPIILLPGCDKTAATCQAKFNNLIHFRGYPYIPKPDSVYDI